MNFDSERYINPLLDIIARYNAFYRYSKLNNCKSNDKYFAKQYIKNLLLEEYPLYSIMNKNISNKKSGKKVSWDKNLHVEYNY